INDRLQAIRGIAGDIQEALLKASGPNHRMVDDLRPHADGMVGAKRGENRVWQRDGIIDAIKGERKVADTPSSPGGTIDQGASMAPHLRGIDSRGAGPFLKLPPGDGAPSASAAKLVGADVPRRAHGAAVALEIIGKDPSETDARINGGTATLQVEVPPCGVHKVGIAKQGAPIFAGARVSTAAPNDGAYPIAPANVIADGRIVIHIEQARAPIVPPTVARHRVVIGLVIGPPIANLYTRAVAIDQVVIGDIIVAIA